MAVESGDETSPKKLTAKAPNDAEAGALRILSGWPAPRPSPVTFGVSARSHETQAGSDEMELRFDAEQWARRTPEERARECMLMAAQARSLAQGASSPELKRSYFNIAAEWDELAQEISYWFAG